MIEIRFRTYAILVILIVVTLFSIKALSQCCSIDKVKQQLFAITKPFPAKIGVCFISDGGDTIAINGDEHFPLLSVMKFHQALAVCQDLRKRPASLSDTILVRPQELLPKTWSPMRDEKPQGGSYSIAQLLDYSLIQSDNNACDILYNHVVGLEETNSYIHSIGINNCEIVSSEKDMAKDQNACYDNSSTPLSASVLIEWFYANKETDEYSIFLWDTMSKCRTGKARIPIGIKNKDVTIVHKTGTGPILSDGTLMAVNDVACIQFPDGRHYSISVFISEAKCTIDRCEDVIAKISKKCYDFYLNERRISKKLLVK